MSKQILFEVVTYGSKVRVHGPVTAEQALRWAKSHSGPSTLPGLPVRQHKVFAETFIGSTSYVGWSENVIEGYSNGDVGHRQYLVQPVSRQEKRLVRSGTGY